MARAISIITTAPEAPDVSGAFGSGTTKADGGSAATDRPPAETEPSPQPGADWAASLVHIAVAGRPVEEVARLFELLDSGGEIPTPSPASAIAAGRPVDELSQLLAALRGEQLSRGQDILRVAVLSRPIDEVVQLVAALGGQQSGALSQALQVAALNRPVDEVVELARALKVAALPAPELELEQEEPRRRRSRWN
ncbi:hypothetical protein [Streptacidiphilus rugosus]|uniref:hypothetical protein n=1 Tax=Streptacidiphilus rugosus TaxID=405783 RepID=UPI000561CFC7|nr:hypothetical protein [Streptacidiphilus rugosus]